MRKKKLLCKWKYDEDEDSYHSSCNDAFCLTTGNLKENHIKYCPFCGKKIEEISNAKT